MKGLFLLFTVVLMTVPLLANTYAVKAVRGAVEVRRGVAEEWKAVKAGDLLRPEDSMRTGKKSSATIAIDGRQLTVPEQTIVDIADFRSMTQEEFLLKLAMENVLAVPQREKGNIAIPRTTVLHGAEMGKESAGAVPGAEFGPMQLQGAKLLYENSFYATSVLKSKETFRLYPDLQANVDARLRVAGAFEKMKLAVEAMTEYSGLTKEKLSPSQQSVVQSGIDRVRKVQGRQ
jgi:hypothetical protein